MSHFSVQKKRVAESINIYNLFSKAWQSKTVSKPWGLWWPGRFWLEQTRNYRELPHPHTKKCFLHFIVFEFFHIQDLIWFTLHKVIGPILQRKSKAQKSWITYSRSHWNWVQEVGLEPSSSITSKTFHKTSLMIWGPVFQLQHVLQLENKQTNYLSFLWTTDGPPWFSVSV